MFSFVFEAHAQQGPGTAEEPFRLSTGARNEFSVLACLAPLCLNDLRVLPHKNLYCVDASPSGAGVCKARVGGRVSREIWRRGDKQGYRAPMLSRLTAALKGSGWDQEAALELVEDSEPEAGDLAEGGVFEQGGTSAAAFADSFLRRAGTESWRLPVPGRLSEGPCDFLELYSGCSRMSGAWAKQGFCVLLLSLRGVGICVSKSCFGACWGCVGVGRFVFFGGPRLVRLSLWLEAPSCVA